MGNEPNFFELADKVVKKRRERVSRSNTFPDFELDIVKYRVSSFFQITLKYLCILTYASKLKSL